MKWFPSDWRGDPLVRACDPISRYVWMEMLGLMHEGEPYGHLVIGTEPIDAKTLSRMIGVEQSVVERALRELERRGVFSKNDQGVILSRRMIRDQNKAETCARNGKAGGNPHLKNQSLSKTQVKGWLKTQIPDTRYQSQKEEKEESALALTGGDSPPRDGWPLDAWEQFYRVYPHKIGKADAQKSFERVRKTQLVKFEELMQGLDRYARKTDDRPWCNPATWLNQQRWADRPAQTNGRSSGEQARKLTFFDIARGDFGDDDELSHNRTAGGERH